MHSIKDIATKHIPTLGEQRLADASEKYQKKIGGMEERISTLERLLKEARDCERLTEARRRELLAALKARDAEIAVLRSELLGRGAAMDAEPAKSFTPYCQNDEDL